MALFVTYDEEGGFFDHLVPPTPPATRAQGLSTVPITNEIFAGSTDHPAGPYGLGVRVPMIIVSPWTRGGWVNSEVFDHTSLIRFMERRFGHGRADLIESNITPWRRAVTGDLTSAFDFKTPNASRRVDLPGTADFKPADLSRQPDQVPVPPADPKLPGQERGVRPARAIPYTLHADGRPSAGAFAIDMRSTGGATGVFQVRSADPAQDPRTYTVESGKQVTDVWPADAGYDLSLFGPNGFFRRFAAGPQHPGVTARARYDERHERITLEFTNRGPKRIELAVADRYSSQRVRLVLKPGETRSEDWSLSKSRRWYGLSVTIPGDPHFAIAYAGHVENGEDSISDPAMGGLI
jgi:phospholipase C